MADLALNYGGVVRALNGVNLSLPAGSVVALLGPNGAGKTSLLRAVSGNLRHHRASVKGEIRYAGTSLVGLGPAETVRRGVVQVPEGRRIFASLTVEENLTLGGQALRSQQDFQSAQERVFELFPVLAERRKQPGGLLSGGEQQMLAIGRAMMASPSVLMLDEPSLGLAPKMIATIADIIRSINAMGTSILLIEQNATMALALAHHAYVLGLGRVVLSGATSDPGLMGEVRRLYLGDTPHEGEVVGKSSPARPRPTLTRWARS
ncbi:ABC transporter ATP-binding protein [Blastococcus tunisiensis]|uniref:ABC transporter ATP-binding protein n=1 Tax=Blastococcus tunisiensis TaxID=1798228 RepID=UPI003AA872BB